MTNTLLIRGGTVVNATGRAPADVLIEDERIVDVRPAIDAPADRVLDATGRYVIPGGVDTHTHLDSPQAGTISSDDFESGTIAAAIGGTTTIVDFAVQAHGTTLGETVDTWHAKAEGKAVVDYGFHVVVTRLEESDRPDLTTLLREGITSVKLFMAYPGELMVDDDTILRVMDTIGADGGLCAIHAEDGEVIDTLVRRSLAAGRGAPRHHAETRPVSAEAAAVRRALALAERADAPVFFVHLSSGPAVDEVRSARAEGRPAYAETCPHYLLLDESVYAGDDLEAAKFVISPPLRPAEHQDHLWDALADGDLQQVTSDHCTFCLETQRRPWLADFSRMPNGGPGIEHRLTLLHTAGVLSGRLSLERWVDVCAATPARLFGMPRKGVVAPGADADVVVFDPEAPAVVSARDHHMRIDYSLYEGVRTVGAVEVVISRGEVIVEGGRFLGRSGRGRFLVRGSSGRC